MKIIVCDMEVTKYADVYDAGYEQGKKDAVVHGHWIHDINNLYGCSECLERETMSHRKKKNYCPNCGALMDAQEGESSAD